MKVNITNNRTGTTKSNSFTKNIGYKLSFLSQNKTIACFQSSNLLFYFILDAKYYINNFLFNMEVNTYAILCIQEETKNCDAIVCCMFNLLRVAKLQQDHHHYVYSRTCLSGHLYAAKTCL